MKITHGDAQITVNDVDLSAFVSDIQIAEPDPDPAALPGVKTFNAVLTFKDGISAALEKLSSMIGLTLTPAIASMGDTFVKQATAAQEAAKTIALINQALADHPIGVALEDAQPGEFVKVALTPKVAITPPAGEDSIEIEFMKDTQT